MDTRSGKNIQVGTEVEVNYFDDLRWSYGGSGREGRKLKTPISRPIQLYRYWFRYLQLACQLEELDYTFIERVKTPTKKKGKKGYQYKEVKEKVVVNRARYEGWDLEELLVSNFDKWWSVHKHLFVETPTHVEEVLTPEDMVIESNLRYFKVDSRMSINDTVRSFRGLLEGSHAKKVKMRTAQWSVTGNLRQEKLFNCYNCLVMWLQGASNESILKSNMFRSSRGAKVEWLVDKSWGDNRRSDDQKDLGEWRPSAMNLNKMRDMLIPARRLVLTVADGYFAKHPKDKTYFKR